MWACVCKIDPGCCMLVRVLLWCQGRWRRFCWRGARSGLWDHSEFFPTSVIQGNLPLYMRGWSLGSPFCCITQVDSISLQDRQPGAGGIQFEVPVQVRLWGGAGTVRLTLGPGVGVLMHVLPAEAPQSNSAPSQSFSSTWQSLQAAHSNEANKST